MMKVDMICKVFKGIVVGAILFFHYCTNNGGQVGVNNRGTRSLHLNQAAPISDRISRCKRQADNTPLTHTPAYTVTELRR